MHGSDVFSDASVLLAWIMGLYYLEVAPGLRVLPATGYQLQLVVSGVTLICWRGGWWTLVFVGYLQGWAGGVGSGPWLFGEDDE